MVWTKMLLRTTLVSTLAGGFLLFSGVTGARADNGDACYQKVQNWEQKLDRDIDRHGFNSRQANHDRHELGEQRDSCRRHFGNYWRDRRDNNRDYDRDYNRDRR